MLSIVPPWAKMHSLGNVQLLSLVYVQLQSLVLVCPSPQSGRETGGSNLSDLDPFFQSRDGRKEEEAACLTNWPETASLTSGRSWPAQPLLPTFHMSQAFSAECLPHLTHGLARLSQELSSPSLHVKTNQDLPCCPLPCPASCGA